MGQLKFNFVFMMCVCLSLYLLYVHEYVRGISDSGHEICACECIHSPTTLLGTPVHQRVYANI